MTPYELGCILNALMKDDIISYNELDELLPSLLENTEFNDSDEKLT